MHEISTDVRVEFAVAWDNRPGVTGALEQGIAEEVGSRDSSLLFSLNDF